jgi:hypothetical protein
VPRPLTPLKQRPNVPQRVSPVSRNNKWDTIMLLRIFILLYFCCFKRFRLSNNLQILACGKSLLCLRFPIILFRSFICDYIWS